MCLSFAVYENVTVCILYCKAIDLILCQIFTEVFFFSLLTKFLLLLQSEPHVPDSSSQIKTEPGSLENIKVKSFAEIMAEKRQRAQQQNLTTESSASKPTTIIDSEKTSPEAASNNAAKKGIFF